MITKLGKLKLEEKLVELKKQLEYTVDERRKAAQEGDLRENAAYHYLGTQVDIIRTQISEIEDNLRTSPVINKPTSNIKVTFGHRVSITYQDGKKLSITIVGKYDSGIKSGWISYESPLAIALMGKKIGELILVNDREVTIEAVESGDIE